MAYCNIIFNNLPQLIPRHQFLKVVNPNIFLSLRRKARKGIKTENKELSFYFN